MGFTVKHLDKYLRWLKQERANYKENAKISSELARRNLRLDIATLRQLPQEVIDRRALEKHTWVLQYLRDFCPETIAKYHDYKADFDISKPQQDKKVWSMWWQGEEAAAPLFRLCIESARRHTHQPVIVLDKDNYSEYFTIPDYIMDRHRQGKIALQHVCDLMVVSVLAEQGGFFTGATVFVSQDVPDEILKAPFYTCRTVSKQQFHMSRSRWVGYLLAGNKGFPLFAFARDFLLEYWKKADRIVDYLLLDYIFELAYEEISCVREFIDGMPDNNTQRNQLIDALGNAYDPDAFRRFTEGDTYFYKLSWKFGDKSLITADGSPTNLGYLLKKYGIEG